MANAGVFASSNTALQFAGENAFNFNGVGVQCSPDTSVGRAGPPGSPLGTFAGNVTDIADCLGY